MNEYFFRNSDLKNCFKFSLIELKIIIFEYFQGSNVQFRSSYLFHVKGFNYNLTENSIRL
ncbi:hypothetical protein BpHYR1_000986 [Brachionus plicatilis]|uniref:Uncharacterized protein n=1 Tax=Brachionus plicatilis TaxID=10195 RepID=A0A3M7T3E7_BRAPC|nr:hypothetical protein BpHYR1_000986 [Brachionus plicatilis]